MAHGLRISVLRDICIYTFVKVSNNIPRVLEQQVAGLSFKLKNYKIIHIFYGWFKQVEAFRFFLQLCGKTFWDATVIFTADIL